ncbi:hypothetical protein [Halorientalis pallida]|uniref:Uncharacterized protein n=1 Tax=Halorientalis pallida TaxID=2479928 RepID=A0A498KVX1_9EURY|nr:hypothetical protein [Halorientalis pallida]RXK49357.1 hypothetical protein EAF64_10600 [Halorientalis pallida]
MIEALLQLLLGVGISVLAVLFALPVTLALGRAFRRTLGGSTVRRVCDQLGGDGWTFELADKVETAIIGGLIGGVVFASLSPAIAPAMYDFHVQSGIVDSPTPAVEVNQLEVPDRELQARYNLSAGNYSVYRVELSNPDQRTLRNFELNARFPGCVERSSLGATNFGTAVVSNETREFRIGEYANRSANATCYGAVGAEEFPPGKAARVTFVVDENASANRTQLYEAPESGSVLLADSFSWTYNGRSYSDPAAVSRQSVGGNRTLRA